jgi:ABC-type antimicrobial peptide transport system ATPase subunit
MSLFRNLFRRYFFSQINRETDKNLHRLTSDLNQKINKEIDRLMAQALAYMNQEINMIETLLSEQRGDSASILERIVKIEHNLKT